MDLRDKDLHLNVLSSEPNVRPRRSFIGDYDRNILCLECDNFLGRFDEYGKKVLLDRAFPFQPISRKGHVAGWEISGCDPVLLEKFFLSIIWRASISSRDFFERVNLGPLEFELKNYLWGDTKFHNAFGCVISKFHPSGVVENLEKVIFDPDRFRYEGINFYRLYLGGYMIWIRVDKRKPEGVVGKVELKPESPCVIAGRSFDSSNEFKVVRKGV